ncbi:MAG: hypothetical protein OXE82_09460 [Rhodobacter sp.]|nr:hypothetical protein [Rhodobacter sp.]
MKRLMMTLAAALVAMLMAAPVAASSDAVCQDIANNTGWRTGTWIAADNRCRMSGRNVQQQQQIEQADARRSHPEARAVYYGTPPGANDAATASIGRNQICINMPPQESKLTSKFGLRDIEVYGADGGYRREGEYWHDPVTGQREDGIQSGFGQYVHLGTIQLQPGEHCVSGKGRIPESEFPISLRPKMPQARVDATNPDLNCMQTQPRADTRLQDQWNMGRCMQTHVAFRKMSHCAGLGEATAPAAASCRIWVTVGN